MSRREQLLRELAQLRGVTVQEARRSVSGGTVLHVERAVLDARAEARPGLLFRWTFATCAECGRTFDLLDEVDAAEWGYGHDCEVA